MCQKRKLNTVFLEKNYFIFLHSLIRAVHLVQRVYNFVFPSEKCCKIQIDNKNFLATKFGNRWSSLESG